MISKNDYSNYKRIELATEGNYCSIVNLKTYRFNFKLNTLKISGDSLRLR
jgi:hypothetical protein